MMIQSIGNSGEDLRNYERVALKKNKMGRFGATGNTEFGLVKGDQYLVMGMLLGQGSLYYLFDDMGNISAFPYPLFEVIEKSVPINWLFKSFNYADEKYPYLEAVWGYHELVLDDAHYELLLEGNQEAERIYFRRKVELEESLSDDLKGL